jgi:short subunit fatty acids transporter
MLKKCTKYAGFMWFRLGISGAAVKLQVSQNKGLDDILYDSGHYSSSCFYVKHPPVYI